MDKNIAALLREDTRTVHVSFELRLSDFDDLEGAPKIVKQPAGSKRPQGAFQGPSTKLYTYVTHLPVKAGDTVIVEAAGEIKLAHAVQVDNDVDIEPNSNIAFKWVIDKVDIAAYEENQRRNIEIERTVGDAYRNNLRRSFAQTVLAGVDDTRREGLTKLLKGG